MKGDAPCISRRWALLALATAGVLVYLPPAVGSEQRFPDVVAVKVRSSGPDVFDFDVTISSPYDTPRRYADGFRVKTHCNQVLGERKLLHDHQDEQDVHRSPRGPSWATGHSAPAKGSRDSPGNVPRPPRSRGADWRDRRSARL